MRLRKKERQAAENMDIFAVQKTSLQEDWQVLAKQEGVQRSRVKKLPLFLSTDGLISCQTRLEDAEFVPFDAKLLRFFHLSGEYVTYLIIRHLQIKTYTDWSGVQSAYSGKIMVRQGETASWTCDQTR